MPNGRDRSIIAGAALALCATCSSSSGPPNVPPAIDSGTEAPPWVVEGPPNPRCLSDGGVEAQVTDIAVCAGGSPSGGGGPSEYGDTLFGSAGYDDDCKYHVAWTSTAVKVNQDVTFTLSATRLADGKPASGAVAYKLFVEAFLSEIHPAPPVKQSATEVVAGTYAVGPVRFDVAGRWTLRFHIYEDCDDGPSDSPHGHIAFFVDAS